MMSIRRFALTTVMLVIASTTARANTLYSDLGGKPGIDRLVTTAMTIWTDDPRVGPTFAETNLTRFKHTFADQLCMITGGDCSYTGRSMADAHRGLHLSTMQFNAIAEDMQAAMDKLDISYSVQARLIALLAPMHRDVVSR